MSTRRKQAALFVGSSDVTISAGSVSSSSLSGSLEDAHKEGYDHVFVPSVEAKYECPICLMVLRDPMQTACGHRFCQVCIMHWLSEKQHPKCPVDNNPLSKTQLFPDNFAKREIMLLDVRCPNCKHGCTTVCQLKQLEHHLELECEFVLVACPNQCPAILFKHLVIRHLKDDCTKRRVKCKRCQVEVTYEKREEHVAQCPNMEQDCTHCGATVVRKDMAQHQATECLKAPAECIFHPFGCRGQFLREDMEKHMTNSVQSHLVFISEAVSQLLGAGKLSALRSDLAVSAESSSLEESTQKLATNVTSGFVTMPTVTQSDSDRVLMGSNRVTPANLPAQQSTSHPPSLTADTQAASRSSIILSDYCALLERIRYQDITLAKHEKQMSELQLKVAAYEKQLLEKTAKLKDYEQIVADFDSRFCNGQYLWKVEGYSQLRRDAISGSASAVHSPGFYTSFHGYKLCVRLNPNGVESGTGTHISLFIHFMKGADDALLDWPFSGKITLYILDQNENSEYRQHIAETLVAKPGLAAFQKPMSSRNHKGFGYIEFAPINLIDSAGYIRNDTLLIKASVVEH